MSLFISAQIAVMTPDGTQMVLVQETDVAINSAPTDAAAEVACGQEMISNLASSCEIKAVERLSELRESINAFQIAQGRKAYEEQR